MAERYRNNHATAPRAGSFWRWQWERKRAGLPKEPPEGYRFPMVEPDLPFLRRNREAPTLTWIGHATLLLQLAGMNILTDPQFSERASPLSFAGPRRRVPPVPRLDQLPRIDVVLISHNHYDHLDRASVRRLHDQPGGPPRFFVPRGIKGWFARLGISEVTELNWWEAEHVAGMAIHCVPAHHWSARTSFDRNATLWCGWVLETEALKIFFAGDTGYAPDFHEIVRRLGPVDLAALPIGHYEPRWFMRPSHVDPKEALQIAEAVGARCAVAIHWGTFPLSDESLDEPPRRLAAEMAAAKIPPARFVVPARGEIKDLRALLRAAES